MATQVFYLNNVNTPPLRKPHHRYSL